MLLSNEEEGRQDQLTGVCLLVRLPAGRVGESWTQRDRSVPGDRVEAEPGPSGCKDVLAGSPDKNSGRGPIGERATCQNEGMRVCVCVRVQHWLTGWKDPNGQGSAFAAPACVKCPSVVSCWRGDKEPPVQ